MQDTRRPTCFIIYDITTGTSESGIRARESRMLNRIGCESLGMISSERMAAVDRNAAGLGVSQKQLMESSGNAIAGAVRAVASGAAEITIVVGRGNNGGDGCVAARFLEEFNVTTILIGRPESIQTEIARENWEVLAASEHDTRVVRDSKSFTLDDPDVVVDALLGTGISGTPREPEYSVITAINQRDATVVSVDVPSGLNADTGAGDHVVAADHVVTFHDMKPGLPSLSSAEVHVHDIGIPEAAELFVGPGDLSVFSRDEASHKGDHGRIHIVGGGPYTGAPALAGMAALRAGADLSFVSAPVRVAREIQGYSPNLIVEDFEEDILTLAVVDEILDASKDRDVLVLGPGLGDAPETLDAVETLLSAYSGKAVVDADALQRVPTVKTDATLVCTPHQGELVEMGGETSDDWRERKANVESFAAELGQVLLVKGDYDVISDGSDTRVNRTGNPGMTVGGTGDVLAGITGALLATHPPMPAAGVGAYVNGKAGDAFYEENGYGLQASDLLDRIPLAMWRAQ